MKKKQKYVKSMKHIAETFKHFTLKQISRSKNKREDAISKLAAISFDHLTKEVLVEILPTRSLNNQ